MQAQTKTRSLGKLRGFLDKTNASSVYLKITSGEKRWSDIYAPLIVTVVFTCLFIWFGEGNPFHNDSVAGDLLEPTLVMAGIFITIVAVMVSLTDDQKGLDVEVAHLDTSLVNEGCDEYGQPVRSKWTRRRYLALMFGFLTVQSLRFFALSLALCYLFGDVEGNLLSVSHDNWSSFIASIGSDLDLLKIFATALYIFIIARICTILPMGLFYITDRIYRK